MEFMLHFCHNPALNKNEDRYLLYFEMLDDWRKKIESAMPNSITGVEKISRSLKLHNSFSFTPTKSTAKPTTEHKTNETQLKNYIIANDFKDVCAILPDNNLLIDNTCCRISNSITFQYPSGQKYNNVVPNERNAMKDGNMVKTIYHRDNRVSDNNSRREIQKYKYEKHSQDKHLYAMIQHGYTKFKEQKSWCSSNKGNHAGPSYKNLYTETVLFSRSNDSFVAREKSCCDQIKEDLLGKTFNNFNMFLVNKFLNRIKKNQLWSTGLIRSHQSCDHSLQTTNKKDCSCPCSKHNKIWLQKYVFNTKEKIENTNTKIDWKYCSESQEMTSCELRLHMFKMKNVDIYHWILHRYIEILFPCTKAIEKENVFKVQR